MSDQDYSKIDKTAGRPTSDASLDIDEHNMRETLGLNGRARAQLRAPPGAATKQRHRFVQDGEVQVIHMSGLRDGDTAAHSRSRITALETSLETERAARSRAEQAMQAAQAQCHALETKLAHVELASRDLVATEKRALEAVQRDLQAALAARDDALRALAIQPVATERPKRAPRERIPREPRAKEPQPVKWWLK